MRNSPALKPAGAAQCRQSPLLARVRSARAAAWKMQEDGKDSQQETAQILKKCAGLTLRSRNVRALTFENFRQDAKLKDIGSTSQSRLDAAINNPEVAKEMAQTAAKKRLEELKAIARDPPKPRAQVVK